MKIKSFKLIATFFIIAMWFYASGQKAKVVSAYNYLKYGELNKAKEDIDVAVTDEKAAEMAKSWYYKARIYHAIHESKDPAVIALDPKSLTIAYESYIKAKELDAKGQYTDEIHNGLEVCALQFVNDGVKYFNAANYKDALSDFENAIKINKLPEFGKIDTLSIYNSAITSEKLGQKDNAARYYNELIGMGYGGSKIFSFLVTLYKADKNNEKRMETIMRGRELFPNDNNLIIEELNFYIETGEKDKAIINLNTAIQNDPENYNLYFALGSMYDQIDDFNKSEAAYAKALELAKPAYEEKLNTYKTSMGTDTEPEIKTTLEKVLDTYFSILYNFGALYFNAVVKDLQSINSIADNVKYAGEKKKAETLMVKALPYLEKALELKPTDKNTITSLRDLYARTGDNVKWEQMQERLEN